MKLRTLRLPAIALAAALAASCTPGGGSIYFTLENEVKVEDRSLPNEITVFDVAKIGTDLLRRGGQDLDGAYREPSDRIVTRNTAEPRPVAPPTRDAPVHRARSFTVRRDELYGGFINDGRATSGSIRRRRRRALRDTPVGDSRPSSAPRSPF